jgi:hypothetical protein
MGLSGQRHAPASLFPWGKGPPVPIVQEAGWTPEPVWTQRLEEKPFDKYKTLYMFRSSKGHHQVQRVISQLLIYKDT